MSTTLTISTTTFELIVGVIVGAIWAILAGIEAILRLIWRYRRGLSLCTAIGVFVGVCVAVPMLPVGLALIAAFGWATWPR